MIYCKTVPKRQKFVLGSLILWIFEDIHRFRIRQNFTWPNTVGSGVLLDVLTIVIVHVHAQRQSDLVLLSEHCRNVGRSPRSAIYRKDNRRQNKNNSDHN